MRRVLDQWLYTALTRNWDKATVEGYSRSMQKHAAATPAHIAEALTHIDTKASGLLVFVALMVAALGVIAPLVAQHPIEEGIVIGSISIYLVIAIGCLRCLSVLNTPEPTKNAEEARARSERELILRQELFRICHRASVVFTVVVCIALPLMLIVKVD
jgi:hypothetical protein